MTNPTPLPDKTQEELERVEKLLIKVFDKHMLPKPYYTLLKDISYDLTHYINKSYIPIEKVTMSDLVSPNPSKKARELVENAVIVSSLQQQITLLKAKLKDSDVIEARIDENRKYVILAEMSGQPHDTIILQTLADVAKQRMWDLGYRVSKVDDQLRATHRKRIK